MLAVWLDHCESPTAAGEPRAIQPWCLCLQSPGGIQRGASPGQSRSTGNASHGHLQAELGQVSEAFAATWAL